MSSLGSTKRPFTATVPSTYNPPAKRRRTDGHSPQEATSGSGLASWLRSSVERIGEIMSRPFQNAPLDARTRLAVLESHPQGSLAMLMSSGRQPITVEDDGSDDDLPKELIRSKKREEARRHLNDHINVHSHLATPLFPTTLMSHHSNDAADNSSGSNDTPSVSRPNVTYSSRGRDRSWVWSASPSNHRLGSPSTSRPQHRKASLRPHPDSAQVTMLDRAVAKAKNGNNPQLSAIMRVRDELRLAQTPTAKKTMKLDTQQTLAASLEALRFDNRRPLDDAVVTSKPKFLPPTPVTQRRRPPPSVDILESQLSQRLKLQDEEKELQLRKRLAKDRVGQIPRELKPDQAAIADARLRDPSFSAQVGAGGSVSAKSLKTLLPGQWLNDEVVNFYVELINIRAKAKASRVHCMSTYLYEKLQSDGYEKAKLKRWTKRMKLDIFALDQLLIPINIGNTHWVSASINFTEKRIEYYDSLPDHGYRLEVFKNLRTYLQAEHREKKGSPLDLDDWEDFYSPKTPRQDNLVDCGVFTCQTLETVARGRDLLSDGFEFSCRNMPFFRRLMVIEIASGELSERSWSGHK